MRRVKIYICAAVFILLTVLKCLLPAQTALFRAEVLHVLERNDDYSQTVSALGRRLAEENPVSSLMEAFRLDKDSGGREESGGLAEKMKPEMQKEEVTENPVDVPEEMEEREASVSERV